MENEAQPRIVNVAEKGRYEVFADGRFAGYSTYELEPGRVVVTHTVIRPAFEGRGIGSRLVEFVVDDIRSRGLRIVPVCPFTRSYLQRHPDYAPIVDYPAVN